MPASSLSQPPPEIAPSPVARQITGAIDTAPAAGQTEHGAGTLLRVAGICKSFGGLKALDCVALEVPGQKVVGLIGPNGSGKSTLFDIISGFQRSDAGAIVFRGDHIERLRPEQIALRGLVRTFQMSEGGLRLTTIENLMAAAPGQREHRLLAAVRNLPATLRAERQRLGRARAILSMLGLRTVADEYLGNLSGGQRKLVDLGRIFMAQPPLALLDEPTAGVNPSLINVIIDALHHLRRDFGVTLLIVEHNMQVVQELCDMLYVLEAGRVIASGPPEVVRSDARVLESYLGSARARTD